MSIWVRPLYIWSISRGTLCAVAIKLVITTFVFSFRRKRKKRTGYYISLFLPGAEKRKLKSKLVLVRFFFRVLVAIDETFEACTWFICTRIKKNRKSDSGLSFFLKIYSIRTLFAYNVKNSQNKVFYISCSWKHNQLFLGKIKIAFFGTVMSMCCFRSFSTTFMANKPH